MSTRRKARSTPAPAPTHEHKAFGRTGRAPLLAVDTNLHAYDRTDPFTALNALRTLLGALPTRKGNSALRFAPEEHRLALHLLTLVEPFVGLAPSRRTLTRQPTEILDAIVFHIPEKRDLLALALSCRRLYAVVCPRHYDYRVIRCKVSALRVWNHLAVHRALARNVRRLEILDERATEASMIPSDITATDTDVESTDDELGMHVKQERFLVSALTRMTALNSFVWSCNHSPISIDNVWPTLLKCQSLKQVDIHDNLVFAPNALAECDSTASPGRAKRQPVLPVLNAVSLHAVKQTYGASKNPDMSRASIMLANCPVLESLSVEYIARRAPGFLSPVVDDFLLCGRWPHLRTLVLTNLWCSPHAGFDATASFLLSHLQLEVLHLDVSFGSGTGAGAPVPRQTFVLPPNCLPRLRELKTSREIASAILECPCDTPGGRPLETIKGVRLSGSPWDQVFLSNLRQYGASTRRLELAGWNDMDDIRRLAECAPQLTWLDVGKRAGAGVSQGHASAHAQSTGKPVPAVISTHFVEWAAVLAQMPQLTTFHGVRFFYEVSPAATQAGVPVPLSLSDRSRVRKNEEVAATLARKCAKLRRLDHWEEGAGKVVVLLRDGSEKVRYEVRRVKA